MRVGETQSLTKHTGKKWVENLLTLFKGCEKFLTLFKGYEKWIKGSENFSGKYKGSENFRKTGKGSKNFRKTGKGSENFRKTGKGSEKFWLFPGKPSDRVPGLKNDQPLRYIQAYHVKHGHDRCPFIQTHLAQKSSNSQFKMLWSEFFLAQSGSMTF